MQKGRIKTIVADRGFGFIEADDGMGDVFLHRSWDGIGEGFDDLVVGQNVEFECVQEEKGFKATWAKVTG